MTGLVPVAWDGLALNTGIDGGGFSATVTNVDGWYGSPPLDGHNADRVLADGQIWGHKILGAREIVLSGTAMGPRAQLMDFRDRVVERAAARLPATLTIGDPELGTSLTAMVRADTESLKHAFLGGRAAFTYEVTVTAADPLLYAGEWQDVTLTTVPTQDTGRRYEPQGSGEPWPRRYDAHLPETGWRYASPEVATSTAHLTNDGNAATAVFATYEGPLAASTLTDAAAGQDPTGQILLTAVPDGVTILVATATLTAEAPGGEARAAYIRPGSRPLTVPPHTTRVWHFYATGYGSVTLSWRSAYT